MKARAAVSVGASRVPGVLLLSVPEPTHIGSRICRLRLKPNIMGRCKTDVSSRFIMVIPSAVVFVDATRFETVLLVTMPEEAHLTT